MFFLQTNGSGVLSFVSSGGKFESALFHVRDEKASGSHGGTSVAGSFQTRVLNTSLTNEISGASLSSNQITLPSGTYYINARMPFYNNIDYVKVAGTWRSVCEPAPTPTPVAPTPVAPTPVAPTQPDRSADL